jgi:membrane protease YdiL (CAAX protease family)
MYIANDKLRGIHAPSSLTYYFLVALLAAIPAWILSGAFTRDPGVRDLLHSVIHPSNWRWQAAAFFFWPALLLIPAAIAHFAHQLLTRPQPHDTVLLSAAYTGTSFLSNFFFTAALEEPGWRGFLLLASNNASRLSSRASWCGSRGPSGTPRSTSTVRRA